MFLNLILEQKENKARGKVRTANTRRHVSRPWLTLLARFAFRTAVTVDCRTHNAVGHCAPTVLIGNRGFHAISTRVGGSKTDAASFPLTQRHSHAGSRSRRPTLRPRPAPGNAGLLPERLPSTRLGYEKPFGASVRSHLGPHGDAGRRPWLFPRADQRARTHRSFDCAALTVL